MNIIPFTQVSIKDLPEVGGKNASLGEMIKSLQPAGINIPRGFVVTASAFRSFLLSNNIKDRVEELLESLDSTSFSNLEQIGRQCRELVLNGKFDDQLTNEILLGYHTLNAGDNCLPVAVRSSATAEDLPNASFAGQHDSYLNVCGKEDLLAACKKCFASLYNDRAIKYRAQKGFGHMKVALSVGVQIMVRSDKGSAGVAFTIEPETGFKNIIYITGVWGLGENIVQGAVSPDEFYFFKPSLLKNKKSLISKRLGEKSQTMIFGEKGEAVVNIDTETGKKKEFVLNDLEATMLAHWCASIEKHYKMPMDIEWAKDGITGNIYIVQARPETIHQEKTEITITEYKLKQKGNVLASGKAVGGKIVSGVARILKSPKDGHKLKEGEILVTDTTSPDWNAVLKKAAVIVTNKGGRTSHASIVARELGLSAVVGTIDATEKIKDGQQITVSCAEGDKGVVYDGILEWEERKIIPSDIKMPSTDPMFILADPGKALKLAMYPNKGVGLLRMEFIVNNHVKVHPMALVKFDELQDAKAKKEIEELTYAYKDKTEFFVDVLSQGIAMVAAAFHPHDVIVRMSDFKTNEYSDLLGGKQFEPGEENPMLGFRGASRYYNERYKDGFRLECMAMKVVREEMGLENVKLMIPFCRTVDEGKMVIATMEQFGLKRGENNLEIYVMAEIPSNVILAEEFAEIFDGFSIGSNDLTQLTLGIDRDSAIVSDLFSEKNAAAKWMFQTVIEKAKKCGAKIGLCGQAPSDDPAFASFLVELGIDSISFNPDAILKGIENINKAEKKLKENKTEKVS